MPPFRRVDARQAGPAALGILVPPGPRTVVVLRPRPLAWDLLPLRPGAGPPAFCDFGRDEAAGVARQVQRALEHGAAQPNPVEVLPAADGYCVCTRAEAFGWIACRRVPGQPYQPCLYPTPEAAQAAAGHIAAFLWPGPDANQDFYFNTQNFSR